MSARKMRKFSLLALGLVTTCWGHVDNLKLNGVAVATANTSIAGGQTFSPNQKVTVTWEVTIDHTEATTYISHSTNGTTWVQDTTFPGPTNSLGLKTFSWNVPALSSNTVKLRVYQAHIPRSNPANIGSDDYNLVSGIFSIQPKVAVIGSAQNHKPFPNAKTKSYSLNGSQIPKTKKMTVLQRLTFSKP